MIYSIIFYGSYLSFPFLATLIYLAIKSKGMKTAKIKIIIWSFFLLLSISFIYARFIEPQMIQIKTTSINTGFSGKVIVVADFHLGPYKGERFLERVVKKINEQESIDAILIPGDFTYYPTQDLKELFKPLKALKFPTFAVLGNHDSEAPGPPLRDQLKEALELNGVRFLHNEIDKIPNTNINIVGLGDHWAGEDEIERIDQYSKEDHLIVITHNPDSTLYYTNGKADLTVSGHTHGGQIRLPWIYKKIIPCKGEFDKGLYSVKAGGKLFVTSGTGEVGLPMRLFTPPIIDVLKLNNH